ncbi:hypothetical protein RHGRI_031163 [Rhododendron griersonianum]|uniref:CN hydrolase domain-containing protein n=1 Tax=Rhododendron griersonianum TaxID=479676 RepID=A0AAV6IAB1_9ERIC|nr:hypothetical protein RHGRI_031163 [Rhododendron griersonianum]
MTLRRKPEVLISLRPIIKENLKYQGQDKLPVTIWVIAQGFVYIWVHYLLPMLSSKSSCNPQSRDLILLILSSPKARPILLNFAVRKGERIVSPSALEHIMRATFPAPSARVKAYDLYLDNLEASVIVLRKLVAEWHEQSVKHFTLEPLEMHLFDINLPGDSSLKESDTFTAGDQPTIVDTEIAEQNELREKELPLNEKALATEEDATRLAFFKDAQKHCNVLDQIKRLSLAALKDIWLRTLGQFKIGLCQLTVTSDKNDNLAHARNSIEASAKQGASLFMLPETWNCPYSTDYFEEFAEDFDDKDGGLFEVALGNGITIVGGSMPEKMHLFDINLPGDISLKESDTFTAGDQPTIVDIAFYVEIHGGYMANEKALATEEDATRLAFFKDAQKHCNVLMGRLDQIKRLSLAALKMRTNHYSVYNLAGQFKIGLCQLTGTSDMNDNLAHARNSIEAFAKQGASLFMLPEMWNCPCSTDYFEEFAEDFVDKDGGLSEVALGNGITIVGDISLKESDTFTAGDQPTIVDIGMHRLLRQVNLLKHMNAEIAKQNELREKELPLNEKALATEEDATRLTFFKDAQKHCNVRTMHYSVYNLAGQFKIGLCQLTVTSDMNDNLAHARNSIESFAKQGASLFMLPEMWNCPYSTDYFEEFAEHFDDKDGGDISLKESDTFIVGDQPTIVDIAFYVEIHGGNMANEKALATEEDATRLAFFKDAQKHCNGSDKEVVTCGFEEAFFLTEFTFPTDVEVRAKHYSVYNLAITSDKNDNLAHARNSIEASAKQGASLVMLPLIAEIAERNELREKELPLVRDNEKALATAEDATRLAFF